MTLVGSRLVRPDARAKASGLARYSADLTRPRMLHGAVVRSPHAAARIVSIDASYAASLPGVACVLTADDLLDRRYGIMVADEPILAREAVRHVGEPVALVAADSPEGAREAAAAVDVEYEPQPAAVRLADAIADGAPRVHGDRPNVMEGVAIARGDVEALFRDAHLVVETTVVSHRVHQGYIEPRAALAELDDDGRLLVTMSSQSPFAVRDALARLLDLPVGRIGVRTPAFGGGFGGKLHPGMAPYAAVLCLALRRPVRVVCSRTEELQASNPRENSTVTLASAVDADGRIRARRATVHLDSGAYAYDTPAVCSTAALQACGAYAIEAVEATVRPVYTNTMPTGSFRGPSGRR